MASSVDGADRVEKDLRQLAERTVQAQRVVVDQAGRVASSMRSHIPRRSGNIGDSTTSDDHATVDGSGVWAEAGPEHFAGVFVEYGTAGHGPRSFVEPTVAEIGPQFEAALREIVDQ